jgi:hypothetical protein
VRCYWSTTGGDRGTLVLVCAGVKVIADDVTLDQASALVAPHFVTLGAPPEQAPAAATADA